MAQVFISFLGIGAFRKPLGYDMAAYVWPEKMSGPVTCRFAQTAVLKALETCRDLDGAVDRVVLFCTEESFDKHFDPFMAELETHLEYKPRIIIPDKVPTDMTAGNQWGWFESLLGNVGVGDRLVMDFTHGMRAIPIIFSSAIGFLMRARHITLDHALYAWYDPARKEGEPHPIVDMKDFYVINDWAESVSRLTEDADARKLGAMARQSQVDALAPLADDTLVAAFQEMTDCIRNVDVNNISQKVNDALAYVEKIRVSAGGSARLMLDLVWEKFCSLATDYPPSGRYDQPYFETQIKIIEVLMEHRLFMQAFTAMREMVGSIGMVRLTGKYKNKQMYKNAGRRYRRFADIFICMVTIPELPIGNKKGWEFEDQAKKDKDILYPWFLTLKEVDIESRLRNMMAGKDNEDGLIKIRNGFDHAWTSATNASPEIERKGNQFLNELKEIISLMAQQQLFSKED